jgi:hypothetical protein
MVSPSAWVRLHGFAACEEFLYDFKGGGCAAAGACRYSDVRQLRRLRAKTKGRALRAGAAPPSSARARLNARAPAAVPYRLWEYQPRQSALRAVRCYPSPSARQNASTQYAIYVAERDDRARCRSSSDRSSSPRPARVFARLCRLLAVAGWSGPNTRSQMPRARS